MNLENNIELEGKFEDKKVEYKIKAKGVAAGTIIAFVVLVFLTIFLDPFHKVAHFVLAIIDVFMLGMLTGTWTNYMVISILYEQMDYLRREVDRKSEANRVLEKAILNNRLSSKR